MGNTLINQYIKFLPHLLLFILGIVLGAVLIGNNVGSKDKIQDHSAIEQTGYTCSMHPQINSKTEGTCPLCGMDLIISGVSVDLTKEQFRMTDEALVLANILTVKVGADSPSKNIISLSGTITANEKTNAVQTTLFDGRIDELMVNYVGEYVKKGEQIGLIYSPELYLAQDKLLTSASYKDTHEKLFNAARNTLGLWKLTDAQINELLATQKPFFNFPLYADVSGTVTELIAAEGNYYKQGDPLFKLSKLSTVWAVFDAYENQLSTLHVGQNITIMTNAHKDVNFQGKINFIEPLLNPSKRTAAVRVDLNNTKGLLKPGMFVEGRVERKVDSGVITIPRTAVLWTGKRSIVYLKPNPKEPIFEMREITLGNANSYDYEVLEGLQTGDEIVVNGTFAIDAAAQLNGKNSMMSRSNTPKTDNEGNRKNFNYENHLDQKVFNLLEAYVRMKDALVASDSKRVNNEAVKIVAIVQSNDLELMDEFDKNQFYKISEYALEMASSLELEKQRYNFKLLSNGFVQLVSGINGLEQSLYVQSCPMADGNKGAIWLSWDEEIKNPYFGEKMLNCGTITDKIQ